MLDSRAVPFTAVALALDPSGVALPTHLDVDAHVHELDARARCSPYPEQGRPLGDVEGARVCNHVATRGEGSTYPRVQHSERNARCLASLAYGVGSDDRNAKGHRIG